jgi:hypothetical protein
MKAYRDIGIRPKNFNMYIAADNTIQDRTYAYVPGRGIDLNLGLIDSRVRRYTEKPAAGLEAFYEPTIDHIEQLQIKDALAAGFAKHLRHLKNSSESARVESNQQRLISTVATEAISTFAARIIMRADKDARFNPVVLTLQNQEVNTITEFSLARFNPEKINDRNSTSLGYIIGDAAAMSVFGPFGATEHRVLVSLLGESDNSKILRTLLRIVEDGGVLNPLATASMRYFNEYMAPTGMHIDYQ